MDRRGEVIQALNASLHPDTGLILTSRIAEYTDAVHTCDDDAVAEGFTELYVTGGEPFLERDLVEMLLYATEQLATAGLPLRRLSWIAKP